MTPLAETDHSTLQLSRHAQQRMAQRSVSRDMVDLLIRYGDEAPCGRQSLAITINKYGLEDLRKDGVRGATVEKLSRLRAVMSNDGTLVTVMHRYHRPAHNARVMRG